MMFPAAGHLIAVREVRHSVAGLGAIFVNDIWIIIATVPSYRRKPVGIIAPRAEMPRPPR